MIKKNYIIFGIVFLLCFGLVSATLQTVNTNYVLTRESGSQEAYTNGYGQSFTMSVDANLTEVVVNTDLTYPGNKMYLYPRHEAVSPELALTPIIVVDIINGVAIFPNTPLVNGEKYSLVVSSNDTWNTIDTGGEGSCAYPLTSSYFTINERTSTNAIDPITGLTDVISYDNYNCQQFESITIDTETSSPPSGLITINTNYNLNRVSGIQNPWLGGYGQIFTMNTNANLIQVIVSTAMTYPAHKIYLYPFDLNNNPNIIVTPIATTDIINGVATFTNISLTNTSSYALIVGSNDTWETIDTGGDGSCAYPTSSSYLNIVQRASAFTINSETGITDSIGYDRYNCQQFISIIIEANEIVINNSNSIAFIGDSIIAGDALSSENKIPYLVQQNLNNYNDYMGIIGLNYGIGGSCISDYPGCYAPMVNRLDTNGNYRFLILEGGINDAKPASQVPINVFRTQLDGMIKNIKNNMPSTILLLMTPETYPDDSFWNNYLPGDSDMNMYSNVMREESIINNVTLIESGYLTNHNGSLYYDGVHPSEVGAEFYNTIITNAILNINDNKKDINNFDMYDYCNNAISVMNFTLTSSTLNCAKSINADWVVLKNITKENSFYVERADKPFNIQLNNRINNGGSYNIYINGVLNNSYILYENTILNFNSMNNKYVEIRYINNMSNITPVIPPVYNNQTFDNKTTTDLATVPDIAAVDNFTIASSTSSVQWTNTVDLSNVTNITSVILTTNSFISINVVAVPSLDTPAEVSLTPPSNNCNDFILYYANGFYTSNADVIANGQIVATKNNIGGDCTDNSICKNVQCTNGVLTFEAQHFDGFGIGLGNIDAVNSCKGTQRSIFAAFSLIALFIIVGAAFLIISLIGKDGFDSSVIIASVVGFIAVAIVVFVGYLIISQVSAGICVI
jgi:lysophospholipase L1-like esterase